jgi:hypothetical protein
LVREFRVDAESVISGLLLDERRKPLAGWMVSCSGAQSEFVMTDKAGSFRFTNCSGGAHAITVYRQFGTEPAITRMQDIVAGGSELECCILDSWLPSSLICGRVFGEGNRPLKGATVRMRRDGYEGWIPSGSTGPGGEFETQQVPPGSYRLSVGHGEYAAEIRDVQLGQAERKTIEHIVLEKAD